MRQAEKLALLPVPGPVALRGLLSTLTLGPSFRRSFSKDLDKSGPF